jgi:glycine reductase
MLTLNYHDVNGVQFGDRTQLRDGVLTVDTAALRAYLLDRDPRLAGLRFDLAHPGESCRVASIFDTVEPRARGDGGSDFPGIIGPIRPVGEGVVRVLRGAAVTVLSPSERAASSVMDMGGVLPEGWRASDLSVYATLHHLIVIPTFAAGVTGDDANNTLRFASLHAAVWLAGQAAVGAPDSQERFELAPAPGLPRVAYVFQVHSHQRPTVPGEPIFYGDNVRHLIPVLVHPNEVLGGAVVQGYGSRGTYVVQNHPVIRELYRRHGHDLDFVGVVIVVAHQTADERERGVAVATQLVKHVLRADGALFTKTGGGAPHVDMAEMAHQCELLGVKTSLIAWETSSGGDEGSEDGSALFNHSDLTAIVNVGSNGYNFRLPAVERVIAPAGDAAAMARLKGPLTVTASQPHGVLDQFGGGHWTMALY